MKKIWKQYWILIRFKGYGIQLINNWHYWKREEWHLISFFRKYHNKSYGYYFALLGFQLRILKYTLK
jgi:hypothetical protein